MSNNFGRPSESERAAKILKLQNTIQICKLRAEELARAVLSKREDVRKLASTFLRDAEKWN
jgi:hypothetical protein